MEWPSGLAVAEAAAAPAAQHLTYGSAIVQWVPVCRRQAALFAGSANGARGFGFTATVWVFDQSSADRIEMHVVQFFVLLPKGPYVEIIEAALPETRMPQQRFVVPKSELRGGRMSPSIAVGGNNCT